MKKTLVLGVGNLLLSDDGVGIHTIQRLQAAHRLPEEVQVVDGGTCGLDLLQFLEGIERLIIVDAAKMGKPVGTVVRLEGDKVPAYLSPKNSPHEIGLPELLFAAKLIKIYPPEVVVFGVQPESLETSLELTPAVAARVDELVELVAAEVEKGGR
jgi:hydrogenase maturation protease